MTPPAFPVSRVPTALVLVTILIAGCSSTPRAVGVLAENVAAHPPDVVAAVVAAPGSTLSMALRAIGVPHTVIGPTRITDIEREPYGLVIVDEHATDAPELRKAFVGLVDLAKRTGTRLVVLHQETEAMTEMVTAGGGAIRVRDVPYTVRLVAPERGHGLLRDPNILTAEDLDSLGAAARQIARAAEGRAVLAGNLDRPDESAAVLELQVGRGVVYYVAMPVAARAAEGYVAEQRLLANLVSR